MEAASEEVFEGSVPLESNDPRANCPVEAVEVESEAVLEVSIPLESDAPRANSLMEAASEKVFEGSVPLFPDAPGANCMVEVASKADPNAFANSTSYPLSCVEEAIVTASRSFINLIEAISSKSARSAPLTEAHICNVNIVADAAKKSLSNLVAVYFESGQSSSMPNIPVDEGDQNRDNASNHSGDNPYSPSDCPFRDIKVKIERGEEKQEEEEEEGVEEEEQEVPVIHDPRSPSNTDGTQAVTYPMDGTKGDNGYIPIHERSPKWIRPIPEWRKNEGALLIWGKNRGEKRKSFEDSLRIQNKKISSTEEIGNRRQTESMRREENNKVWSQLRSTKGQEKTQHWYDSFDEDKHYSEDGPTDEIIKEKRLQMYREMEEKEKKEAEEEEERKDEKLVPDGNWSEKKRRDDDDPTDGSGSGNSGAGFTQRRGRFFNDYAKGPNDQGYGNGMRQYGNAGNGNVCDAMDASGNEANLKDTDDQLKLQAYLDYDAECFQALVKGYQDEQSFHKWGLKMAAQNRIHVMLIKDKNKKTFNQTLVWRKAKYSNKRIQNLDEPKNLSPKSRKDRSMVDKWLDEAELMVKASYKFTRTFGEAPITV